MALYQEVDSNLVKRIRKGAKFQLVTQSEANQAASVEIRSEGNDVGMSRVVAKRKVHLNQLQSPVDQHSNTLNRNMEAGLNQDTLFSRETREISKPLNHDDRIKNKKPKSKKAKKAANEEVKICHLIARQLPLL